MTRTKNNTDALLLLLLIPILVWSAINPVDRFTWYLEVLPVFIGLAVVLPTYRIFPLTTFLYGLLILHALVLFIGGHYTYAEVPLFNYLRDIFGFSRNHYDRLGHFIQGFVPAIIVREILLRKSPIRPGKLLYFLVVCVCLSISAFYELIEWWIDLAIGNKADSFLGTQGDIWDTQWDMTFALIGANTALMLLSSLHDRALDKAKLAQNTFFSRVSG
jgi:putative membrane protein